MNSTFWKKRKEIKKLLATRLLSFQFLFLFDLRRSFSISRGSNTSLEILECLKAEETCSKLLSLYKILFTCLEQPAIAPSPSPESFVSSLSRSINLHLDFAGLLVLLLFWGSLMTYKRPQYKSLPSVFNEILQKGLSRPCYLLSDFDRVLKNIYGRPDPSQKKIEGKTLSLLSRIH